MRKIKKRGSGKVLSKGKRALSPVVATVLLVALVLILALIVFMWSKGFLKERIEKRGESAEAICEQLRFDANYQVISTNDDRMTGTLQVINRGTIPIYGFDIKQVEGGNVKRTPFFFSVNPGETIPSMNIALLGDPQKLEMFPIILGSVKNQKIDKQINKQYTCLHASKKINLESK
jgi:flagellin-like protein